MTFAAGTTILRPEIMKRWLEVESQLPAGSTKLLLFLASVSNFDGPNRWRRTADLAEQFNTPERTIRKQLLALESAGLIMRDAGRVSLINGTDMPPNQLTERHTGAEKRHVRAEKRHTGAATPQENAVQQPKNDGPKEEGIKNNNTKSGRVVVEGAPNPPPEAPPNALRFFERLAGFNFAMSYNRDLSRWYEEYTPEFLQLAWRLAPTVSGGKSRYVFVDWLNRESGKPWPEELTLAYRRALHAVQNNTTVPGAPPALDATVRVGDRVGRVIAIDPETHRASVQVGESRAQAISVPWSALQAVTVPERKSA